MWIALAVIAACGAEPKQPFLANAPHPETAAVAGAAAGVAAAAVLADPNASTRGKPEKQKEETDKQPIDVKEHVTGDVLDRADVQKQPKKEEPVAKPAAAPKRKGPLPKLPLPSEAIKQTDDR
jgi:hypothetical protein